MYMALYLKAGILSNYDHALLASEDDVNISFILVTGVSLNDLMTDTRIASIRAN